MTTSSRVTLAVFRVISTAYALLIASQTVWMGLFLEGRFEYLLMHRTAGGLAIAATFLLIVSSLSLWWPGRVARFPVAVAVLMLAGIIVQFTTGTARTTSVHIPLGVVLIIVPAIMAVWSWRPRRTPVTETV